MARRIPAQFKFPLWDRLTNPMIAEGAGVGSSPAGDVERIKDAVRRDLEWLLNSKRPFVSFPEGVESLEKSVMAYGLPDITSLCPSNTLEVEQFQKTLEGVIRDFEPRLTEVVVSFNPLDRDGRRASLHYRIDALLRLDPFPEPIVFDTILDLGSRAFSVRREGT